MRAATVVLSVYDNVITSPNNGRVNDAAFPPYLEHADSFALSSPNMVNRMNWLGGHKGVLASGEDHFILRFYRASGLGFQAASFAQFPLAGVSRETTGLMVSTTPIYTYSAIFPDLALGAGTYLMSIYNNPDINANWLWGVKDASPGKSYLRQASAGASSEYVGNGVAEFSFALYQVVPEPTFLGFALPCFILWGAGRQRKNPN